MQNEGDPITSYLAPYVRTRNLSTISLAKSSYRVLKWDINDMNCGLERQLRCKNEGDPITSYLAPYVRTRNLRGMSFGLPVVWAFSRSFRHCRLLQLSYRLPRLNQTSESTMRPPLRAEVKKNNAIRFCHSLSCVGERALSVISSSSTSRQAGD